MGLSDGRKRFPIGLAVLIQYRSVTDTQPASHVAVVITLNALAKASSLKTLSVIYDYANKFLSLSNYTVQGHIISHQQTVQKLSDQQTYKKLSYR